MLLAAGKLLCCAHEVCCHRWLEDVAAKHYEGLDALSNLQAVMPAAGWGASAAGSSYVSYHYRAQVAVPPEWLDALGASRVRATIQRLGELKGTPGLAKGVRLYVATLQDIARADLHLLTVCLQDLPLQTDAAGEFLDGMVVAPIPGEACK